MILYLDSSALLKLYVDEAESAQVRTAVAQAARLFTHGLTYTEIRAALAMAHRLERVDAAGLVDLKSWFEADWRTLDVIPASETLLRRAGHLAEEQALRGFDAVHLAAAEAVASRLPAQADFRLAAFDQRLSAAASRLGMRLLDG